MEKRNLKRHAFLRLREAGFEMDKTQIGKEPHLTVRKMRVLADQYRLIHGSYGKTAKDDALAGFYKMLVTCGRKHEWHKDFEADRA